MKKVMILLVIVLCCGSVNLFAQCDKDVVLTATKTEYLDSLGNVTRSVDEKTTIQIGKENILVKDGDNPRISGKLLSKECSWSKAFKQGKSIYTAKVEGDANEVIHTTITIEGKNDKVWLLFTVKEKPNRIIRVYADTFETAK